MVCLIVTIFRPNTQKDKAVEILLADIIISILLGVLQNYMHLSINVEKQNRDIVKRGDTLFDLFAIYISDRFKIDCLFTEPLNYRIIESICYTFAA